MSKITLKNISLTYPIYGNSSRSLKRDILSTLTGRKSPQSRTITSVNALKNVSLTLNRGDRLGLVGHNGSGKTTLLKVLSGIYDINQGEICVTGSVSSLLGSSVGMQPELTGLENIRINSIIKGYSKEKSREITNDVAEFTELGDFLYVPVKMYSAGMQARLAFGISTAICPDILLLDEVVGTGDARFINKAMDRIEKLMKNANILVLASHSTDIIKQFCDKALWLDHGEIKGFGDVNHVLDSYLSSVKECVEA